MLLFWHLKFHRLLGQYQDKQHMVKWKNTGSGSISTCQRRGLRGGRCVLDNTVKTGVLDVTEEPWAWRPGVKWVHSTCSMNCTVFCISMPSVLADSALKWGNFLPWDTAVHDLYFISINTAFNSQVTVHCGSAFPGVLTYHAFVMRMSEKVS